MEQRYELEYDPKEPIVKKKEYKLEEAEPKSEESLGDVYDMYGMISNVHSKMTSMTRDYVLAQYTSDVINAKFPRFVREQRKTLRIIKSFLIIPIETLKKRYQENDKYAIKIYNDIMAIYKDIEQLLIGELDEMVIISRAGQGEVTKAMLMHGQKKEDKLDFDDVMREKTMKDKLLEKQK